MQILTSKHLEFGTKQTATRHLSRVAGSVAGLLVLLWAQTAHAATITVTGSGDTNAVDGVVTLREAIISVNLHSNVNADVNAVGTYTVNDTINFNIAGAGVKTISPTTGLPLILSPVTINGYT